MLNNKKISIEDRIRLEQSYKFPEEKEFSKNAKKRKQHPQQLTNRPITIGVYCAGSSTGGFSHVGAFQEGINYCYK